MNVAVRIPPRRFGIRFLVNLVIFELITVFVVAFRVTLEDGSLVTGVGDPLQILHQSSALQILEPYLPV